MNLNILSRNSAFTVFPFLAFLLNFLSAQETAFPCIPGELHGEMLKQSLSPYLPVSLKRGSNDAGNLMERELADTRLLLCTQQLGFVSGSKEA